MKESIPRDHYFLAYMVHQQHAKAYQEAIAYRRQLTKAPQYQTPEEVLVRVVVDAAW